MQMHDIIFYVTISFMLGFVVAIALVTATIDKICREVERKGGE